MPKCQFLFSAIFGFRNPSKEIFSELDEINAQYLIFPRSFQNTGERPDRSQGAHTPGRRGQGPGRAPLLCHRLVALLTPPLRLFKPPRPKSSIRKSHGTRNHPEPPPSRSQDLGDRSHCSGTPPGQGSAPGRHLHRHHRHLHQRCCLP